VRELTNKEKELNKKLGEVFLYEYGQEYTEQICEDTDALHEKYKNLEIPDSLDSWFDNYTAEMKAQEQKARFQKRMRLLGKRVAIFLAAFLAVSGTLTFSVEAFRLRFFNIFFADNDTHTGLELLEGDNAEISKPAGWVNYYYPTYLPKGYDLESFSGVEGYRILHFSSGESTITMNEIAGEKDYFANIDTEDVETEEISINGNNGIYVFKSGKSIIAWLEGDSVININGPISREEIIKIAEMIKKMD